MILSKKKIFAIFFFCFFLSEFSFAIFSLKELKLDHFFELEAEKILVKPEKKLLSNRLLSKKEKVDPLRFYCKELTDSCYQNLKFLARKDQELSLANSVTKVAEDNKKNRYVFEFTENSKDFLDFSKLQKKLSQEHYQLKLKTEELRQNPQLEEQFFSELKYFFTDEELAVLRVKIQNKDFLLIDEDLLPSSVRSRVGKYTSYLGPNCFEATLAFQDENFSRSYLYNVKNEPEHHGLMINNDELFLLLKKHFFEIDPKETSLRYGDVILFADYGEALSEDDFQYSWIKHTAVFLLNYYTFSKGSKSADSPYTVKTLKEEWKLWSSRFNLLKIKVFRKLPHDDLRIKQKKLVDWMY
jgi:hypothetical protein